MYPSFSKIFSQNGQRRFLVVGDVFLDDYLYGSVKKVSTGIKIPIVDQESSLLVLGGAGNVAANIAGLSTHVSLVAQVGEDECGGQIRKLLDSKGIRPLLLPTDKSIRKQRVCVDGQQIVRIDSGSFMRGLCQEGGPARPVIPSINAIEPRFYPQSGRPATVAH